MNIRYIKYGIYTACIALLLMAVSSCNRTEIEDVEAQGDGIEFAFSENRPPESKSGVAEASGEIRTITLKSDTDEMVLYRSEKASGLALDNITETKGTPVTTSNLGSLYMDKFFTTAYDADNNSKFANPVKLTYEEIKENKSIWRVTESFAWPEKDGKLSFWAWAPNDIIASTKTITDSEGKMTFTYTMPAPGAETEKKDAEAQKDIILGHTTTGKPDNYIDMNMIHALSGLRFEMDNSVGLKVKNITLSGVLSEGTCTFTPDASKSHAYEQIAWTDLSDKKNYSQDFDQTIISGTGEDEQEIGTQEATFMVIPQCATEISLDLTYEIGGKTKHITANLTGEDWKAGVTYVYNIGHPVFDNYYLAYHWNDGGKHSGDQEIFKQEEYTAGGPHDIILQEPYWTPTSGDTYYYTFLGWAETPDATEAEYVQPGRSETGLKTAINLTNEYTNLYAIWKKVELTDPWVDYENYMTNAFGNFRIDHLDDWQFNKSITLTGQFTVGHEKIGFPIHNLTPGKWYYIKFSETLTPTKTPYNDMSGIYGCTMKASSEDIKPHKKSSMISFTTNADPKAYVWTHTKSDAIWNNTNPNYEHEAMSDQILTFYASAETMYWVWDLSKINDHITRTYSFSHSEIQMITEPATPAVNMLETSLYGFKFKAENGDDEDHDSQRDNADCKGCSTFKVNADFKGMEMKTFGTNKYEKVNIPLINLVPWTKYKLSFNYTLNILCKYEGSDFWGANDLCFGISTAMNTKVDKGDFHNTSSTSPYYVYSDNIASKENECGSKDYEIEFIAQEPTMYWVWSVSKMADNTVYQHLFKNVSLTVIE